MHQNGRNCKITPLGDVTATGNSNDNSTHHSTTDNHAIQLTDNHATTNHYPQQNPQTANPSRTTNNRLSSSHELPNINNTPALPSDTRNPSLNYIRNNNNNNNMLQPQQSYNNQYNNGLANLMASLQNIQSMQNMNTNNRNTYRDPSPNINNALFSSNNSISRERMQRSEQTRNTILNNRMRRGNFNNNRNRRRSPSSSDNERSRSRHGHNNARQRPSNIHNNVSPTPLDIPNNTPTPIVPAFPSIPNVIDKRQAVTIYNQIANASSPFSDNVIALIAEFSIGTLFVCNNNRCDVEVLTLESGDTINGIVKNPQSVVQPAGRIDVNDSFMCYCVFCMNITRTCGLNMRRFKMQDQIRNIFNGVGNVVFNGGRGCFSDLCEFEQLVCSKQYIDNNNNTYCSGCRNGKQIAVGNMQISIICDEACQEYRIGAERHQMFAYGGDSHTNLGGIGGSNIHNNVRYNGRYNGGYNVGYY